MGMVLMAVTGLSGQEVVDDPAPDVRNGRAFIWIRDFAELPRSESGARVNRINQVEPFSRANGWLGVNDLNGPFHMVNYQGTAHEYVDLRDVFPELRTSPGAGTGFTSFAAHPEFDRNGKFYTAHTEAPNSGTPTLPLPEPGSEDLQGVVTEWIADDPAGETFAGTRRELLRIDITGTIHGLQEIAFRRGIEKSHPDYGLLYICSGEGQILQYGPLANTGTPFSPLGTLLRIDPEGTDGPNGAYGIPPDNPYADGSGGLPEVWAYGFRNPHRIAWDNTNDHLLITDIGERQVEELNLIEPGRHYGWPVREGPYLLDPDGNTDVVYELPPDDEGYTYPVAMYDHEEGFAIAGGFVYRNARIPELKDRFLASDIRSGDLFMVPADELEQGEVTPFRHWFLRDENGVVDPYEMVGGRSRTDLRIGTDPFGEIYILTKQDGRVRKLISPGEPQAGYGLFEGYPWTENWVDAAGFLGWSYVGHYPWVYLQRLGKFIHAAPSEEPEGWVFVPR